MPKALRQFFFFAVVIAVPVASYFLVFAPQNDQIQKAKREIEMKRAMLEKLREATSQTEDLARANQEVASAIEAIESRLPGDKEIEVVLREIGEIAETHSLDFRKFTLRESPKHVGPAAEQRFDVHIHGAFDGFYKFLLDLERFPRLTRVLEMALYGSDRGDGSMRAEMVLSIYHQGARTGGTP